MKYIGAAIERIGADFWGAVLRVFIPAILLGYVERLVAGLVGGDYGEYIAFAVVRIPALCLIVLLVAEGGGFDFENLWEGLRMVYVPGVTLGIFMGVVQFGGDWVLGQTPLAKSKIPIMDFLVGVVTLMVAVPLVQRQRGLTDAVSAAVNVVTRDFGNVLSALLILAMIYAGMMGVSFLPFVLKLPLLFAGFLLVAHALFYVMTIYTFVQFFEYESPEAREVRRRAPDLSGFPSVWRGPSQVESRENEDASEK